MSKLEETFSDAPGGVEFRIDKRDTDLQQNNQLCFWSPDGTMVAAAKANKVKVWAIRKADEDAEKRLSVIASYSLKDSISLIEWSADCKYILCAMYKVQTAQVVPVDMTDDWTASVCEGVVAGMVHAQWSPDARHILTTAEFNLHITIWSLTSKSVFYVKDPKDPVLGLAFSHDGKYMAVARREACKDYVGVYHCETWELVKEFQVDTVDLVELQWSPDDSVISIRDSVMQYGLFVYTPDGHRQKHYEAYKHCLGIKGMKFSPSGQFLALGSYDEKVRILNHLTWSTIATYEPTRRVDGSTTNLFVEVENKSEPLEELHGEVESKRKEAADTFGRRRVGFTGRKGKGGARTSAGAGSGAGAAAGHTVDQPTHYSLVESTIDIACVDPPARAEKSPPRIGVGLLEWSPDSRHLAIRNDNMPSVVWIYETASMELEAVLVHLSPVRAFKWSPRSTRLAIVTGNSKIYFWERRGATCLAVKDGFTAVRLKYNHTGAKLVVLSRNSWVCGFLV